MKIYTCPKCHNFVTEIIVYPSRRVAVCVQCGWHKLLRGGNDGM